MHFLLLLSGQGHEFMGPIFQTVTLKNGPNFSLKMPHPTHVTPKNTLLRMMMIMMTITMKMTMTMTIMVIKMMIMMIMEMMVT